MSVGFGFSVGDFIAALNLVNTVVTSLRDAGGSSAEYQSLISQLYALETALLRVKRLELDDSQYAEVIALRQAASQCQVTIDRFWRTIEKYQPSLRTNGSGSRVKDGWRKIKWAVCKSDDLAKFKADLIGHTESIELLLITVQMDTARIDGHKHDNNHRTLVGKVQDSYFGCMQRLGVLTERLSSGIQQGRQLLEMTASIIQTNVQIFKIVLNIQTLITRIPTQVDRQQPVFLIDAIGRHTPFHLEFITCAESLTAVLKNNFKNIGSGARMIENGNFALEDLHSKRDLNLSAPWESCFTPGQKVGMSMIFIAVKLSINCPRCHAQEGNAASYDHDIECKCGMTYRRSAAVQRPFLTSWNPQANNDPEDYYHRLHTELASSSPPSMEKTLKRKAPLEQDDEIALFRRVRIKSFISRRDSSKRTKLTTTRATEDAIGVNVPGLSPSHKSETSESKAESIVLPGTDGPSISKFRKSVKHDNQSDDYIDHDGNPGYPYPCDAPGCIVSFTKVEHLTRHLKTHNGDRSNPCNFLHCGKRFGMIENLLRHTVHVHEADYERDPEMSALYDPEMIVKEITVAGGSGCRNVKLKWAEEAALIEQQERTDHDALRQREMDYDVAVTGYKLLRDSVIYSKKGLSTSDKWAQDSELVWSQGPRGY